MKNLVTLLVAGVMAVMLTACGEEPKKADMNTAAPAATMTEETKAPAEAQENKGTEEAAPAPEAAPATEAAPAQ